MARSVKQEEYAVKRNEILDAARKLIYTKGYEPMTIQDILDDLHISKGAFYHYFGSKQALLEALIERMQEERDLLLTPIVHDPHLSALTKLQRFFDTLAHWKTAQKDFLIAITHILYADDNAIFRQKTRANAIKRVSPLLAVIIHQGIQEGVLMTPYPDQVGEVVVSLVLDLGDALAGLLLASASQPHDIQHVKSIIAVYTDALERTLRTPDGSLSLVDAETLNAWFVSSGDNV